MYVELLYTPGCNSYVKALQILQTIIAEERLPISVDVVEKSDLSSTSIRVDGDDFDPPLMAQGAYCRLYRTSNGLGAIPAVEQLRDFISMKWKDITVSPLLRGRAKAS